MDIHRKTKSYLKFYILFLWIIANNIIIGQSDSDTLTIWNVNGITEEYKNYLDVKENDWDSILLEGDNPSAKMHAHMGLSLIRFAWAQVDGDIMITDLEPISTDIDDKITDLESFIESELMSDISELEFIDLFFAETFDPDYYNFSDSLKSLMDALVNEIDILESPIETFIDSLNEGFSSENFEYHINTVKYASADFTFYLEIEDYDTLIFNRAFFDNQKTLDQYNFDMNSSINDGLVCLDNRYHDGSISDGDLSIDDIQDCIALLRQGIDFGLQWCSMLETLLNNEPLTALEIDTELIEDLKANISEIDTLLGGKEYNIGPQNEEKTMKPLNFLVAMHEGFSEEINGFYWTNNPTDYTFSGIFPNGLPQDAINFMQKDMVININVSIEQFEEHLTMDSLLFTNEISFDPNDADAHLGLAYIKLYHLIHKLDDDFDDFINYLKEGDIQSIFNSYNLDDFNYKDELSEIRSHLDIAVVDDNLSFVILYERNDDDHAFEIMEDESFDLSLSTRYEWRMILDIIDGINESQQPTFEVLDDLLEVLDAIYETNFDPDDNFDNAIAHFKDGYSILENLGTGGSAVEPVINEWQLGISDILTGLDTLKALFENEPFAPFDWDVNFIDELKSDFNEIDELLDGKEYDIGPSNESKTIRPVGIIENIPVRFDEVIKDFYRIDSDAQRVYTFGNIFPNGLYLHMIEQISADAIIYGDYDDDDTFLNRWGELEEVWQTQIESSDDPDPHMGLAISKSLKLLDDTSTSLDETFNYLDDGYVNEFYNSWHNIDISDKVDEIINNLENFSDADDAMFIILVINNGYDPENSNHTIDSNSDFEVIPFHSINAEMVLEISDGMINGAQAITDFSNNLYSNMDQIIDVDLNPNYLDFSDFEIEDNPSFWNDPALIDVFKASNPNWLSLTDEGIEWFHNGGDDLENAFKEINSFITELDDISQEQDMTLIFDDDFDNIKDLSEQLYNDFANPSSTTVINDENVNLSAWFDYPPISFLTLWENVVLGTDSTLYCLFPDRSSMIFLCNNVSEYDLGDVNGDGSLNIMDVVRIINVIVGNASFSLEQMNLADINQDGNLNILDVVQLINMIMGYDDELLSRSNLPKHLDISLSGNSIRIPSDGAFGGLQLITEGQYSITETQLPEGLELYKGYQGIVIINLTGRTQKSDILISYNGEMKIINHMVSDLYGNIISSSIIGIPMEYSFNNAYPNPFNPVTTISYGLPLDGHVQLVIYDLMGRQVDILYNDIQHAGYHQLIWNANIHSSGMYFVRMHIHSINNRMKEFDRTQKMLLIK